VNAAAARGGRPPPLLWRLAEGRGREVAFSGFTAAAGERTNTISKNRDAKAGRIAPSY
jgi:hypothetical protein